MPRGVYRRKSAWQYFTAKVRRHPSGCAIWTGNVDRDGYGNFRYLGRQEKAHRVMWRFLYGDIPEGMVVRHKCDTPGCVLPDHLQLGSQADNIRDRDSRGRTASGERSHNAKLTEAAVAEIRRTPRAYGAGVRLAERFGVHRRTIYGIWCDRSWKRTPNTREG